MNIHLRNVLLVYIIVVGSFFSPKGFSDSAPINAESPQHQEYLGLWQTIDDETNEPRSLVLISINNGQLSAKITRIFPATGESDDPLCEQCKGKLKDVKIIGMDILSGMAFEENAWQGGEILDPNNGKFYDAKIWLENGQLQVRGYIGFFFRTQQWHRYRDSE